MIRAALLIVLLSGCAGLEGKPDPYEYAWHGLNVIDTGQTVHIAREPDCYHEKAWPTRDIIGRHPDEAEVYALMTAYSVGYHYMNRWLDNKAKASYAAEDGHHKKWKFARATFNFTMFAFKVDTIIDNHDLGLRPWGRGCSTSGG